MWIWGESPSFVHNISWRLLLKVATKSLDSYQYFPSVGLCYTYYVALRVVATGLRIWIFHYLNNEEKKLGDVSFMFQKTRLQSKLSVILLPAPCVSC